MSAEAVGAVFRYSSHTGSTLLIQLAIADSVNDMNDFEVWARQTWLAEKVNVSRKSANEAIQRLVVAGDLEILEDNARVGRPNRYRFVLPRPVPSEGVSRIATPGVTDDDTQGVTDRYTEAVLSIPSEQYSQAFLDAWDAYPRKLAKASAWKAWKATLRRIGSSGTNKSQLVTAAKNYATYVRGRNPEHMLHAATFYGPTERWRDFVDGVPTEGSHNPVAEVPAWMHGGTL